MDLNENGIQQGLEGYPRHDTSTFHSKSFKKVLALKFTIIFETLIRFPVAICRLGRGRGATCGLIRKMIKY